MWLRLAALLALTAASPAPPASPGCVAESGAEAVWCAEDAAGLRALLAAADNSSRLTVRLPEGTVLRLGGLPLDVAGGLSVRLVSVGAGATLDGGNASRVARVRGSGRLELMRVHIRNGKTFEQSGGCVLVEAGGALLLSDSSLLRCAAASDDADIDATAYPNDAHGGSIASYGGEVRLERTHIGKSSAVDGAAIFSSGGTLEMLNSSVVRRADAHPSRRRHACPSAPRPSYRSSPSISSRPPCPP